jgi:hypothetical protein
MKLVPGTTPEPTMMGTRTTFETGRANGTAVIDVAGGNATTEATAQIVTRTKVRVIPVSQRSTERGGSTKPPASAPAAPTSQPAK